MNTKSLRICIAVFLIAIFLCPSFGMMNTAQITGNAKADYVDASNNTNCIEEDPLVPGWSKDVRLTNDSGDSMHPSVVTYSNSVYAIWEDIKHDDDYWGIYFAKSIDEGKTWCVLKRINDPTNDGHTPSIIADQNGIIHVAWSGAPIAETDYSIYYKKSNDGGNTWSNDTRLTYASGESFTPRMAIYENILHIVWSDKRDGNFEIYYKKSADKGDTWSEDIQLTVASGSSGAPTLAADPMGNIHIVWQDNRGGNYSVYYKTISNNGILSEDMWLVKSSDKTIGNYPNPVIAIDLYDNIYVTWADYTCETLANIFLKKSFNGGKTWGDAVMITEQPSTDSYMPSIIACSNNVLYLFWKCSNFSYLEDGWYRTGNDLYYISMPIADGIYEGSSNEKIVRLTHAVNKTRMYPKVAIDQKGILHMVWFDDRSNDKEIYYKRTLNPVTEPPIIVTQALNVSTCKPGNSIIVSGNAAYNNSIVSNANVTIKILEIDDEWTTVTDSNGNYSKTITAPDIAGNYTIRVTITSGNHTGWKMMRLTVEQESTNGGTINDGTTNGGQTNGEENKQKFDFNYVIMIVAVIAVCIIMGLFLVKRREKTAAKTEKEKVEKTTMGLRCPKCRKTFRVELKPKPFNVKCPFCGKEGTIK